MIDTLLLRTGQDIYFPDGKFYLHQPTISEIALFGQNRYHLILKILVTPLDQLLPKDKIDLSGIDRFDVIMSMIKDQQSFELSFKTFLVLMIPNINYIDFTGDRILLLSKDAEGKIISYVIDREILDKMIPYIADILNAEETVAHQEFNPVNKRAAEIAEKIMRGRERAHGRPQASMNFSLLDYYCDIISTLGYTQQEINNMTIVQATRLFNRYKQKVVYDEYFQLGLVAGHKDDEPMNHWLSPEIKDNDKRGEQPQSLYI